MDPFFTAILIAWCFTKDAVVDLAYKSKRDTPPSIEKYAKRHGRKPSGFRQWLSALADGAFENAAVKARDRARRKQELYNEQAPQKNAKWKQKKLAKAAKRQAFLDKLFGNRGKTEEVEPITAPEVPDAPAAPTEDTTKKTDNTPKEATDAAIPVTEPPEDKLVSDVEKRIDAALAEDRIDSTLTEDEREDEAWKRNEEFEATNRAAEERLDKVVSKEEARKEDKAWEMNESLNAAERKFEEELAEHVKGMRRDAEEEAARQNTTGEQRTPPPAQEPEQEERRVVRATAVREDVKPGDGEPLQLEAAPSSTEPGKELAVADTHRPDNTHAPSQARAENNTPNSEGDTEVNYEAAVQWLNAIADRIEQYRLEVIAFTDAMESRTWGQEVVGPLSEMDSLLADASGDYRDESTRMKQGGDQVHDAYDAVPYAPDKDVLLAS